MFCVYLHFQMMKNMGGLGGMGGMPGMGGMGGMPGMPGMGGAGMPDMGKLGAGKVINSVFPIYPEVYGVQTLVTFREGKHL